MASMKRVRRLLNKKKSGAQRGRKPNHGKPKSDFGLNKLRKSHKI